MMTFGHFVWTVIFLASQHVLRAFCLHNCDALTEYWDDVSDRCELCARLCFPGQGNDKTCSELCPGFQQQTSSTTSQPPVEKMTVGHFIVMSVGISVAVVVLVFVMVLLYKKRSSIRFWFKKLRRGELTQGHLVTEEQGDRNLNVPRKETEAMMGANETTLC